MKSDLSKFFQAGLTLILGASLTGCSDSPKQYPNATPTAAQVPKSPDDGGLSAVEKPAIPNPNNGGSVDEDELTRRNAREAIVYGVGAGGITFESDFKTAQTQLSKPFYGPDVNGQTAYNSGMEIWWRSADPRVPQAIVLSSDYLGALEIGGNFGAWRMNQDLNGLFAQDEKGEKLLVSLFNVLEKKDASYDCLKKRVCQITGWEDRTAQNIIMDMPKMQLLISKDRKVLFRMALLNSEPKGKLHHDLDLATGEILIPAEQAAEHVKLGQSWGEILAINEENAKTEARRNFMAKVYDGVYLGFTKSNFDRKYKSEPDLKERLRSITVYDTYQNNIRLGGKLVELKTTETGVSLALVGGEAEEGKEYLRLKVSIEPKHQLPFLKDVVALLRAELSKNGDATLAEITGLHKPHGLKTYSAYVAGYNSQTGGGRLISLALSEETRGFSFIEISAIDGAADKAIIPGILNPLVAGGSELAGFKLGDKVMLTDADIGRGEATVGLPGDRGNERADYVDKDVLSVSYDGKKVAYESQVGIAFGALSVRLGLVPQGASGEHVITSITSRVARVTKLCGIEGLEVVPGEEDTAFMAKLHKAVRDEKAKKADFDCRFFFVNDAKDTGRLAAVYFADHKMRINFSERELSGVTIYTKPGGGQ